MLIAGVSGDEDQAAIYSKEVQGWQKLLAAAEIPEDQVEVIQQPTQRPVEGPSVRDQIRARFAALNQTLTAEDDLIVVLIGYGTTRNGQYQFQIRGPRLTDKDLADGLNGNANSYFLIATGPGGGPLTRTLAGDRRVILSATAEETEINQTQFGRYWLEAALAHPAAPLTEILASAEEKVADYYKSKSLARTEHATLSIGGDKPVEAPFETNLPADRTKAWTLASPGAWQKNSGTKPATAPSNVER